MTKTELLEKVGKLGFPLFTLEEKVDVNQTLSEVVKAHDMRLLEGFPVLLANSAKQSDFNNKKVEALLSDDNKLLFREMLLLAFGLYKYLSVHFDWTNVTLSSKEAAKVTQYRNQFAHNLDLKVGKYKFSPERLVRVFNDYYLAQEAQNVKEETDKHHDLSLEYALSQVFSPKQKQLFLKKVRGESLNKTEREYFSRTVKRKVNALANSEVNRLAKTVLGAN